MTTTPPRCITRGQAREVGPADHLVHEYYEQQVPEIGLATAVIEGDHPDDGGARWVRNDEVEEMLYVIRGRGQVRFADGEVVTLEPQVAVWIPRRTKFRYEGALGLEIVVATSPAWRPEQHVFSAD